MIAIRPLSETPDAQAACIGWSDAEWGQTANFTTQDWQAEFDRILAHPVDEVFVAFDTQNPAQPPVGMVWLLEHEDVASHRHLTPWLSSLVVDPAQRNRGIARALMDHLEQYVRLGGDDFLHLLTETPAVYFTKDWEVLDTAPLGDGHVFVMRKSLAE